MTTSATLPEDEKRWHISTDEPSMCGRVVFKGREILPGIFSNETTFFHTGHAEMVVAALNDASLLASERLARHEAEQKLEKAGARIEELMDANGAISLHWCREVDKECARANAAESRLAVLETARHDPHEEKQG